MPCCRAIRLRFRTHHSSGRSRLVHRRHSLNRHSNRLSPHTDFGNNWYSHSRRRDRILRRRSSHPNKGRRENTQALGLT